MAAPRLDAQPDADTPIVIVGAGPVGLRVAHELRRRDATQAIVLYDAEPQPPYNRILLSPLLAGDTRWQDVATASPMPDDPRLQLRLGVRVLEIDRAAGCVLDGEHRRQPYASLVLATGSRPRVPDLPGIGQAHVYVFRSLADVERLMARRVRSRHTVVLGGGLLGLEAARAMQRQNTRVTVIEHGPHLMGAQLDPGGAALLRRHAEQLGLQVRTDARVKAINGHGAVQGLTLRDGERIDCDTIVVAAGIVPELRLALDAGLAVGRGIRVDDRMLTSDPHILAVGECAEHRGRVHGLLAPGLEQAAVAAHTLIGGTARYEGSIAAARLKVLGLPVFSLGEVAAEAPQREAVVYGGPGLHRRLVLERGRVVGVQAVGPCEAVGRLQAMVLARERLWPWQRVRLRHRGLPWPEAAAGQVADWPDDAIVCNCNGVTRGTLRAAATGGCTTVESLSACTRAGTVCGSCRPLLAELAGAAPLPPPRRPALALLAGGAALLALVFTLMPGWAFDSSVQLPRRLDTLWRDGVLKQASGYTLLGLTLAAVALGLRKRVRRIRWGGFDAWRLVHVAIGAFALAALWVHTGARAGHHLNLVLGLLFVALIGVGGLGAGVIALEHRLPPAWVRRWRERSLWLHLLLFWPVPVLLTLHVAKTYWY